MAMAALTCAVVGLAATGASAAPGDNRGGPVCDPCGVPIGSVAREGGRTVGAGQVIEIIKRMAASGQGSAEAQEALAKVAKVLQCMAASESGDGADGKASDVGTGADGGSTATRQYTTISNVLKAKHDTVKNCVQNIRA